MAPSTKITKEDIVSAAVEQVRRLGEEGLNARGIATAICCSTQPIFSNFKNMEELKAEVIASAAGLYDQYAAAETASGKYPPYKASGMAYIRFAREERELFKLLFMRQRDSSTAWEDALGNKSTAQAGQSAGVKTQDAPLFHLEMWALVHGIATMVATGYYDLDEELISRMLTDGFCGLKTRFEVE